MIPAIAYDLTRLLLGPALPVPRGIDRVDLGYARYFLESWQGECVGILPLPLGLLGGVLVIERGAALGLLNLIAEIWGENGMPDGDPALAHIQARLADPLSDLAQRNPPYHFRPHRIVLSFLKALFRMGPRGLRLRRSIARGAIYVNTGQLGLAFPWATAWLNRRPDVRRVYMLHDVIPLEYPKLVTPSGTRLHARMIENTARHADGLIVTTETVRLAVRRELAKCGRHDIPTMAAPLPVASLFLADAPFDTRLSGSPYFVIVGSIEPRKNHSLLVDVWTRLVAKDTRAPKLVIVGTPWRDADDVVGTIALSDRLRQAVIMVTGLTSPALCRLIRGAEGLLVPSFIEGFGLPIVEALALGTPVIASDLPAHREAGGGFVTYLDPRDADAWEAAIGAQLQEPQAHRARLKSYSPWDWSNYAACLAPFLIGMA